MLWEQMRSNLSLVICGTRKPSSLYKTETPYDEPSQRCVTEILVALCCRFSNFRFSTFLVGKHDRALTQERRRHQLQICWENSFRVSLHDLASHSRKLPAVRRCGQCRQSLPRARRAG